MDVATAMESQLNKFKKDLLGDVQSALHASVQANAKTQFQKRILDNPVKKSSKPLSVLDLVDKVSAKYNSGQATSAPTHKNGLMGKLVVSQKLFFDKISKVVTDAKLFKIANNPLDNKVKDSSKTFKKEELKQLQLVRKAAKVDTQLISRVDNTLEILANYMKGLKDAGASKSQTKNARDRIVGPITNQLDDIREIKEKIQSGGSISPEEITTFISGLKKVSERLDKVAADPRFQTRSKVGGEMKTLSDLLTEGKGKGLVSGKDFAKFEKDFQEMVNKSKFSKDIKDGVIAGWKDSRASIVDDTFGVLTGFLGPAGPIVRSLGESLGVGEKTVKYWDKFKDAFGKKDDDDKEAQEKALMAAAETAKEVGALSQDVTHTAKKDGAQQLTLQGKIDKVVSVGKKGLKESKSWWKKLLDKKEDGKGGLLGMGGDGLAGKLLEKVAPMLGKVAGFLGPIAALTAAFAGGYAIGTVLDSLLTEYFPNIKEMLGNAIGKTVDFFADLPAKALDYMQASAKRMEREFGEIIDFFKTMPSTLGGYLKTFGEFITSPSKWFGGTTSSGSKSTVENVRSQIAETASSKNAAAVSPDNARSQIVGASSTSSKPSAFDSKLGTPSPNLAAGVSSGLGLTGTGSGLGLKGEGSSQGLKLGSIAAKHESGKGGVGTVSTGKGDFGGVSYGVYQLSSKAGTLQKYLKESGYDKEFTGLEPGSPEFSKKWKELAKSDPKFGETQHDFIAKVNYSPLVKSLKKNGLDFTSKGQAIQEMLFSIGNQYGPGLGADVVSKALQGKDPSKMTDSDLITTIQKYRADTVGTYFKSSSVDQQSGVAKRAGAESKDLLALANSDPLLTMGSSVTSGSSTSATGNSMTPINMNSATGNSAASMTETAVAAAQPGGPQGASSNAAGGNLQMASASAVNVGAGYNRAAAVSPQTTVQAPPATVIAQAAQNNPGTKSSVSSMPSMTDNMALLMLSTGMGA